MSTQAQAVNINVKNPENLIENVPPDRKVFRTSAASHISGVPPQTIRYYAAKGLLGEEYVSAKKHRYYSLNVIEKIKLIYELNKVYEVCAIKYMLDS